MQMETSMKRTALSFSAALVLCAAAAQAANVVLPGSKPAAAAPSKPAVVKPAVKVAPRAVAPPPGIPSNEVENLVKAAAQLEKSDGCEAAYAKYKEAGDKVLQMRDH